MSELIRLENIRKSYGSKMKVDALIDCSLYINQGEMVAVMGKSGSGKSTLLNIIAGVDCYDTGRYYFLNNDIEYLKGKGMTKFRRDNIGVIVQNFALIDDYTIFDNIALIMHCQNKEKRKIKESVHKIANNLDIENLLNKYPNELSGGQAQRVAIARAMINKPKILLADEPTGALDIETGNRIMELFRKLKENGTTIIIVTHDNNIAELCDRIIYITDGRAGDKYGKEEVV